MCPCVVIRPSGPQPLVNQRAPSGPVVIPPPLLGESGEDGSANSVIRPCVVMRPILLGPVWVNQRAPSGPAVISAGPIRAIGRANSLTCPCVVMRPILLSSGSVNQSAPSDPTVIPISYPA